MKDKIIQEVWQAKDAIAAKYKHDVYALAKHLRQQEKNTSGHFVDRHSHRVMSARSTQVAESAATYPEK